MIKNSKIAICHLSSLSACTHLAFTHASLLDMANNLDATIVVIENEPMKFTHRDLEPIIPFSIYCEGDYKKATHKEEKYKKKQDMYRSRSHSRKR